LHNGQGRGELIVNLRGLFVNSGFFDPISQIDYGEFYYNMGLIDRYFLYCKCMLIMLVVCGMHAKYLCAGLNEITLLGKKWKRRIAYGRGIGVELSM
jgi:hypothetical protein